MPIAKKNNNVLVLFSSPHEESSTKKALDAVLENLSISDPTIINMYDQVILPCIDCKACIDDDCIFNSEDDMGNILQAAEDADILIFATPIYFNSVPAPLKVFIDRLEQLFVKKENIDEDTVYQKRGVLITTMGSDEEYVTNSIYSMFKQVFSCFSCEFMKYYFVSETDKFSDICLKEYRQ